MSAHVQQASVLTGRHMTLMAVIGLHALIIAALIAAKFVPPSVDQDPPVLTLIPVPPPEVVPPPPAPLPVPPRDFIIAVPPIVPPQITVPEDTAIVAVNTPQVVVSGPGPVETVPAVGPPAISPPKRVFTELQWRAVKDPAEFYPTSSVQLQEEGVSIVQVCVNAAGRIEGVPAIQTSSGYKRLDQAAIRWAREALRFTPATENGVGIAACKGFRVVFNLN